MSKVRDPLSSIDAIARLHAELQTEQEPTQAEVMRSLVSLLAEGLISAWLTEDGKVVYKAIMETD